MNLEGFPEKFWVLGTDTGIGKTLVSALLQRALGCDYFKPIQSGLTEGTDTESVKSLAGLDDDHYHPECYRLTEPLSPHASARLDGIRIELDSFAFPEPRHGHLLIEGAGGLLVPLNEESLLIDLVERSGFPVILVARSGLGTINHSLLSLKALRDKKIPILGVILSGEKNPSNKEAIEHYGRVKVLFELERLNSATPQEIERIANQIKSL